MTRENAAIAVFITLQSPSPGMNREAVSAGHYESKSWGKHYPKIQILTIKQLLNGHTIQMPPVRATFKKAQYETKTKKSDQEQLL